MPSYERWGGPRIVEQQITTQKENLNLVGGLKNALERGASIEQAKQSFVNAGYKTEDIEAAAQEVSEIVPRTIMENSNSKKKAKLSKKSKKKAMRNPSAKICRPPAPAGQAGVICPVTTLAHGT